MPRAPGWTDDSDPPSRPRARDRIAAVYHRAMSITWRAIDADAGMWHAERTHRSGFHWRSVAVRLADGTLAIASPLAGTNDDGHRGLDQLGGVSYLLAPNKFHWLGLAEYRDRHGAAIVAAASSVERIQKKGKRHALAVADVAALAARLPPHASLLVPDGLKNGEVWLRVTTTRGIAWIVSDAFFNLPATPTGVFGVVCRLASMSPGLRIGGSFKMVGVGDARTYQAWLLERIARDEPRLLIPSHGEIIVDDELPAKLRALAETRL